MGGYFHLSLCLIVFYVFIKCLFYLKKKKEYLML